MLTDEACFNIEKNMFGYKLRRKILVTEIAGITTSTLNNEFVLHVKK